MIQVAVNSIIYASEIAIIAIGITLSFSVLRFANFAHIQYAVIGGYLSYVGYGAGLPIWLATALSMVGTGLIAVAVDQLVFRRIRHVSPEGKMIASWGIALFLRSVVAAIFGGSALFFDLPRTSIRFGGAFFTTLDIIVVGVALGAMAFLHVVLRYSRWGVALRALASNFELAEARGIPAEQMIRTQWFASGAYAALGGTLFAILTQLKPNMDLLILLPVFAAITIGGLGNVYGAVLGAFVLAFAQNTLIAVDFGALVGGGTWYVPSQFRDAVAVGALVLVLLIRPRGLLSRRGRAAA